MLREVSEQRQEVRTNLDELKHKTNGIQQTQSLVGTRIGDMENAISLMGIPMANLDAKFEKLLGLLSNK